MRNAKHTPGPWRVFEHSWCDTSIGAPGTSNAICRLDINHATEESQEADEAQMAANARLIAAAPAMYEYIASSALNGCTEANKLLEAIHASR